jgi:molybdate transport system substrate-binding protein
MPIGRNDLKQIFSWAVLFALALGTSRGANAQQDVTLVAPGGARAALEALIPGFESKTGLKVKATFGSGLGTKKQVAEGAAFDVPVVQEPYPEVLASGNVIVKSEMRLASVAVGIAVKKGAPKPDISTAGALKKTLLAAKSITYPDAAGGAAAGVSFEKTLRTLGIADQVQPKLKRGQGGAGAMALVAKGDAEIGLTFLSEMRDPGIDVVGPLPRLISEPTVLAGFVSSHAKNLAAAKALLRYLSSPAAASTYRSQGMQPRH